MKSSQRAEGFTIIELMVVIAIIGVVTILAMPTLSGTTANARLRDASMEMSAALSHSRSEAIRTGDVHLVFFQKDASGAALNSTISDSTGPKIEILIVNDGRPGSANQNCKYDSGEGIITVRSWPQVGRGIATGTPRVPTDLGTGAIASGSSYKDPSANPASWVLFRPEGSPRTFDSSCAVGKIGTGAGAFYITNGERTSAVVMMPMGGTRIHTWAGSQWSE